jgi:hypothetical protein
LVFHRAACSAPSLTPLYSRFTRHT